MFPLIPQPVIHLVSCDQLRDSVLFTIDDCFSLSKDDLSLLRAALITSDIIPIGMNESTTTDEEEDIEEKEEMKQQNDSSENRHRYHYHRLLLHLFPLPFYFFSVNQSNSKAVRFNCLLDRSRHTR
ncbi:uncharacterized protein MONOS_12693 [Monocercomonoides exilis]|uniref:uncharacterized protein n=1 Tax=Monocercomonoides exilis TaxID=2049356 RepID=UPI00355A5D40|nr:hypothetical protein MONOS_12693 [Monocercomonoides exilis]